jgi:septal ring factor EnvC (AmiA/AmiB activator)
MFTKYLLAALAITLLLSGAYYIYSQKRIETLIENSAKLKNINLINQESIKKLENNMQTFQELNRQLQQKLQESESYGDELKKKLARTNLTILSLKKASEVEKKINDATTRLFREMENDTKVSPSK